MSEIFAYRANDELAAAWREHVAEFNRHVDEVVRPFVAEHPDNEPVINSCQQVIGFTDRVKNQPPPDGLSRSQRRGYLIPMRGRAGDVWREHIAALSPPSTRGSVLRKFGVREVMYSRDGHTYLGRPDAVDFGDDGVFVYVGGALNPVPDCLTAVRRSEFYAIEEKHAERAGAA